MRSLTKGTTRLFGLEQNSRPARIYFSCFVGTAFHVFIDSFLYSEMDPLYPIAGNPFSESLTSSLIYESSWSAGFVALFIYLIFWVSRASPAHEGMNTKQAQSV